MKDIQRKIEALEKKLNNFLTKALDNDNKYSKAEVETIHELLNELKKAKVKIKNTHQNWMNFYSQQLNNHTKTLSKLHQDIYKQINDKSLPLKNKEKSDKKITSVDEKTYQNLKKVVHSFKGQVKLLEIKLYENEYWSKDSSNKNKVAIKEVQKNTTTLANERKKNLTFYTSELKVFEYTLSHIQSSEASIMKGKDHFGKAPATFTIKDFNIVSLSNSDYTKKEPKASKINITDLPYSWKGKLSFVLEASKKTSSGNEFIISKECAANIEVNSLGILTITQEEENMKQAHKKIEFIEGYIKAMINITSTVTKTGYNIQATVIFPSVSTSKTINASIKGVGAAGGLSKSYPPLKYSFKTHINLQTKKEVKEESVSVDIDFKKEGDSSINDKNDKKQRDQLDDFISKFHNNLRKHYDIAPQDTATFIKYLNGKYYTILVVGYSSPTEPKHKGNIGYSVERATSIKNHLIKGGIPKTNVAIAPMGKCKNDSEKTMCLFGEVSFSFEHIPSNP